jgi:hypothetical protein
MSKSIMQSTQVLITVQISGDREQELVALLAMLTQALAFIWRMWQGVNLIAGELAGLSQDFREAASFTAKVLVIGLTAWLYGVGVRL